MKNNTCPIIERIKLIAIFSIILLFISPFLFAENVRITQIDTSRLISTQSVRLFVNFGIPSEESINPELITVQESADGITFQDTRITGISRQVTRNEGISFLLLLDNSGSMWDDLSGKPTDNEQNMRMTHAKRAIREFVASLSPLDRAGLAVFNTNYTPIQEITDNTARIPLLLDQVEKPSRDDGYTELYGAIHTSLNTFGQTGRRKVLIVLSDGEHFPFSGNNSTITADDGINAAITEGITCYVVNFGNTRDSQAPRIASESGGLVFNAKNDRELSGIYTTIREQILNEYAVTYIASMIPGDKRYVKISSDGYSETGSEATRYYYSGTLLGTNTASPSWHYVLFLLIPALLWLLLLFFKLEKPTSEAGLQLLYGAKGMQTKAFTLNNNLTVIGGSNAADITIAGNPAMKENAATIVFDKKQGNYTIAADSDMTVNNKPVKSKKLEPGDVINISGTVVVYNDPSDNGV